MGIRIGINGLGRIGRGLLRRSLDDSGIEVAAVNDVAPPATLAHLLRHDSLYGPLAHSLAAEADALIVDGRRIPWTGRRSPAEIPWRAAGVDYVVEATGQFARREAAAGHLAGGARRVVISAPSPDADVTLCLGVNDAAFDPARHTVISNASCTTNAAAVALAVADRAFGVEQAAMTTVHCLTNNQMLMDAPHPDLRRARAAPLSMVPTTTSAAEAIVRVLPGLAGRLHALAVRVPTSAVSLVDLTILLRRPSTQEAARDAYRAAAGGAMAAVLAWTEEPLVSIDFLGTRHSAVIDGSLVEMRGDRWLKVYAWYDNERGYVERLCDLARLLARHDAGGSAGRSGA